MKLAILISLVITFWITVSCKKRGVSLSGAVKVCFTCDSVPEGTIFCDDFESETALTERYFEYDDNGGDFVRLAKVGRDGSAGMRVIWQQGETSAGSLKKSFGRTSDKYIGRHAEYPEKDFNEIYWRVDVKRQAGWQGGGADKLTRAIV